jgi:hypothetical protein
MAAARSAGSLTPVDRQPTSSQLDLAFINWIPAPAPDIIDPGFAGMTTFPLATSRDGTDWVYRL